jgi:Tfp pilus assembly protein PilO
MYNATMTPLNIGIFIGFFLLFLVFLRLEYASFVKKRDAIRQAKAKSEATIASYTKRQSNAPDMQAYRKAHQQFKKNELDTLSDQASSNSN